MVSNYLKISYNIVDIQLLKSSEYRPNGKPGIITFDNEVAASVFQKILEHYKTTNLLVKIPNPTDNIEYTKKLNFIMAVGKVIKRNGTISNIQVYPSVNVYTGNLVPRIKIVKKGGIILDNVGNVFDAENLYETKWHSQIIQAFLRECGVYEESKFCKIVQYLRYHAL